MNNSSEHKMDWISVKDIWPQEGVKVLTWNSNRKEQKVDYIVYIEELAHPIWAMSFEKEYEYISHWMPLPKAPNGMD